MSIHLELDLAQAADLYSLLREVTQREREDPHPTTTVDAKPSSTLRIVRKLEAAFRRAAHQRHRPTTTAAGHTATDAPGQRTMW